MAETRPSASSLPVPTPATLPDAPTWYLVTNLPAPGAAAPCAYAPAAVAEVVRLYGLRMWGEQSYKQVKQALGWAQYQVRADCAIRRHWHLVSCAFSLCWWAGAYPAWAEWDLPAAVTPLAHEDRGQEASAVIPLAAPGEKSGHARSANEGLGRWPIALRRVRAWLEPGIMPWRYRRAWPAKPPPPALQQLLDWLREGCAIDLYIR
jgi:hypothetical protein